VKCSFKIIGPKKREVPVSKKPKSKSPLNPAPGLWLGARVSN